MAKLTFVGDIALNGEYIKIKEKNIDPFIDIKSAFSNSDFIVGNLEALCAGSKGVNLLKSPRLSTSEKTLSLLKKLNLSLLTIANNHVYDNLEDGFCRTINELNKLGIPYVGVNSDPTKKMDSRVYLVGDLKVAFLNYVHPATNPNIPKTANITINIYDRELIIEEIKYFVNKADLIIVIPHWGIDNSYFPAPWQRSDARAFIKAGAHLVIGHHSHTIQGYEKIKDGYVFYSLGNFCFSSFKIGDDEYGLDISRNSESFILNIFVDKSGISNFEIIPIVNRGIEICFGENKTIKKIKRLNLYTPFVSALWFLYLLYLNFFYKLFFFFFGNGRKPLSRLKMINKRRIKRLVQLLKMK